MTNSNTKVFALIANNVVRLDSEYSLRTSSASMPNSCWGRYVHVALIEHDPGYIVKSIDSRPKAVRRIIAVRRNLNDGTTDRCARAKAEAALEALADRYMAAQDLLRSMPTGCPSDENLAAAGL